MTIGGFLKTSLVDYPNKLAAVVFTQGCNFRCPYCHNRQLWSMSKGNYSIEEIVDYCKKNQNLLDGIVITGGEPTLQPDLEEFLREIKNISLAIKLDTNGSAPQHLEKLLAADLLDYVAMDLKTALEEDAYSRAAGIRFDREMLQSLVRSIAVLRASGVEHEFRTTMCRKYVTKEHVQSICAFLGSASLYYLQRCRSHQFHQEEEYSPEEMRQLAASLNVPFLQVRE